MQERKKLKIVIASVLKPVDETRMFEKIGLSLSKEGHAVSILGYAASGSLSKDGILLFPSASFKRISPQRVLAPLLFFIRCMRIRPNVLIITTHELLVWAVLTRLLTASKIIYDVQENYYLNILHTSAFPKPVRFPLALVVRACEQVTAPFIHHFFLAESIYVEQLKFIGKRFTIIKNKSAFSFSTNVTKQTGFHRLLFSGTLAQSTGVFTAIQLTKQLHALDAAFTLTIIGYAPQTEMYEQIKRECREHSFIRLIGGNTLVSHLQILAEISKADYGLICYLPTKSTAGRTPTKFYEYAAAGLRLLVTYNQSVNLPEEDFKLGITQAEHESPQSLLERMKHFTCDDTPKKGFLWESEEVKLLSTIKSL